MPSFNVFFYLLYYDYIIISYNKLIISYNNNNILVIKILNYNRSLCMLYTCKCIKLILRFTLG